MTMTIQEFCDRHNACSEGRDWALSTGAADMAALWARDDMKPEWRAWIATQPGVLDDSALRMFACWSVRQVWHLLTDDRSRKAVEVAERYARGEATVEEQTAALAAAWDAAWAAWAAARAAWAAAWAVARAAARAAASDAARAAASDAALAAARDAARAAASDAARAAASDAAWDAAWDAARAAASDAARAAARDAAWDAAWDAQSSYLRHNTTPTFEAVR